MANANKDNKNGGCEPDNIGRDPLDESQSAGISNPLRIECKGRMCYCCGRLDKCVEEGKQSKKFKYAPKDEAETLDTGFEFIM